MPQSSETYRVVINQSLALGASFADNRVPIDGDGDFLALSVFGSSDGPYTIKFRNSQGKDMSTAEINNANAIGTGQFPVPFGNVQYKALGQISYSISNTHSATNNIQIVIEGVRVR